ncbi:hypothetical protein F2Q70_00002854 [Brassica cretica]|uniref:Uncharacterized protein n=1 Tax=Brassica cretica TaxID=69181 RepID=A0A8S9IMX4_BRACR|nr:hypothetical protein F2Q70_00002854 [Brassica cretica]
MHHIRCCQSGEDLNLAGDQPYKGSPSSFKPRGQHNSHRDSQAKPSIRGDASIFNKRSPDLLIPSR